MRKKANIGLLVILLLVIWPGSIFAINGFERGYEIDIPEATLNNGGVGDMISGVDVDGDGALEIYLVNDNWSDGPTETVPRLYKLEQTGSTWAVVWSAVAPIAYQNTWPSILLTDLDGDGKMEITWFPINSTGTEANPSRVVVYEHAGGDVFGVSDGAGGYNPNAAWTIVDADNINMRPVNAKVADVDADGVDELIFADRKGQDDGYFFMVISVSDVPDTGDDSEVWTLEASGLDFTLNDPIWNKWDTAILGSNMYFFCEGEIAKLTWSGTAYEYTSLPPLAGGISFDAVQVADIDDDGTLEMITGEYSYGDGTKSLWLLQEDGDTLVVTQLYDINGVDMLNGGRLIGGASGDIDQDGYLDFVFGSRFAGPPNAMLFRLAYRGGDITDGGNYQISVIDADIIDDGGIWNVINIANVDTDPELEVLYTSSSNYGDLFGNSSYPIVVLNYGPALAVDEDDFIAQPTQFVLHQNYPNPFNPVTTISYSLPYATKVNLVIYNMVGRQVVTLVNDYQQSGAREIQWNATDANGNKVSSGMYIYRLVTDSHSESRKMLLLK